MVPGAASTAAAFAIVIALTLLLAGPGSAAKGKGPDGLWRGGLTDRTDGSDGGALKLKVVKRGRQIRDFKTTPNAICINPNAIGGIEVKPFPVSIDRIKVKRNGSFSKRIKYKVGDGSQVIAVEGRLRGKRLNGTLVLDKQCSETYAFKAKRKRR